MEASEPDGNEMVPAGGHGETGDAGEDEAGGGDEAELQEEDGHHGEEVRDTVVAEGVAEGLWDGGDVVDMAAGESDHGAGAGDEHRADGWRGEDDRLAD